MRQIKVKKITPARCLVKDCKAPVEYIISYNDPLKPGPTFPFDGKQIPSPTILAKACAAHVVEINYLVLMEAGLIPDMVKGGAYVGTTDESKT